MRLAHRHTTKHVIRVSTEGTKQTQFPLKVSNCKYARRFPCENLPWVHGLSERQALVMQVLGAKPHVRGWCKSLHAMTSISNYMGTITWALTNSVIFYTTNWLWLKPCEIRMSCPKCSLPDEEKTKMGCQEVISRNIWVASSEATLKSSTLEGHWVSRHWGSLDKYCHRVADTILLSSSSQNLMRRKELVSSPVYMWTKCSESLNELPKVKHLANYGARYVSSEAGGLNHYI